jgi:hypothetical protein
MAEKLLDGADVHAALDEMGGEAVAKSVAVNRLAEAGGPSGFFDGALQRTGKHMMASQPAGSRTAR